jgi:hypothetical protein
MSTGFIVVAVNLAIAGTIIYLTFIKPAVVRERLRRDGEDGTGTIKEVKDTGSTLNESPLVKITLSVKPDNKDEIFDVILKTYVPRINPGKYQPGMVVRVRFDSSKKQAMIIED